MRVSVGIAFLLAMTGTGLAQQKDDLQARRATYIWRATAREYYECSAWVSIMKAAMENAKPHNQVSDQIIESFHKRAVGLLTKATLIAVDLKVPLDHEFNEQMLKASEKRVLFRLETAESGDPVFLNELTEKCQAIEKYGSEPRIEHFTREAAMYVK